jgi:hypothetical protein
MWKFGGANRKVVRINIISRKSLPSGMRKKSVFWNIRVDDFPDGLSVFTCPIKFKKAI